MTVKELKEKDCLPLPVPEYYDLCYALRALSSTKNILDEVKKNLDSDTHIMEVVHCSKNSRFTDSDKLSVLSDYPETVAALCGKIWDSACQLDALLNGFIKNVDVVDVSDDVD